MRIIRIVAGVAAVFLVAVLLLLSRLGSADPAVALRGALEDASYEGVTVDVREAAGGGASAVVIGYDPLGQPANAVEVLSLRAAELAWTRAEIEIATVTVRPRGGPAFERDADQLRAAGVPPQRRERFTQTNQRGGRVVALAVAALLLTGALVVCASLTAVLMARRRRHPQPGITVGGLD